jgi:hypothetical protein
MITWEGFNASDMAGFLALAYIELTSINNIIWLFLLKRSKRRLKVVKS